MHIDRSTYDIKSLSYIYNNIVNEKSFAETLVLLCYRTLTILYDGLNTHSWKFLYSSNTTIKYIYIQ